MFSFLKRLGGKEKRPHVSVAELTARILDGIPDNKVVHHGYPYPEGVIDHVVITKHHGIFVVELSVDFRDIYFKDGHLMINGEPSEEDLVGDTLKKAVWLRDEIKKKTGTEVWTNPLLVFPHLEIRASLPIQGVRVVCLKYLVETIKKYQATEESMAVWLAHENGQW